MSNYKNKTKILTLIFVTILAGAFLFSIQALANQSSHYDVEFNGRTFDEINDTSSWSYTVSRVDDGPGLSHWLWQPCFFEEVGQRFVSATPPASEVGFDGSTLHYGVKWETGEGFTEGTFTVTITGQPDIDPTGAMAVIKAGQAGDQNHGNQPHFDLIIPGPDCSTPEPTYIISGKKFNDKDCDGERGCGENLLGGWKITIEGPNQFSDSVITFFGLYYFDNLYPGAYTVCEALQEGWEQTYPTENNGCHIVEITDFNVTGIDFANHFGSCEPLEPECTTDSDCDDEQWCNGTEICNLETNECQPGTPPDCSDEVNCTDDSCDEDADQCVNAPNDANCSADEWVDTGNTQWVSAGPGTEKEQKEQEYRDYYCDEDLDCQCATTDPRWIDTGATRNKQDETPCSDGNACTENDVCSQGVCSGTPINCDDGIECTVDTCVGGVCQHDTSACTCVEDIDCDDSNPCTDNTCNLDTYSCELAYNANQCDDNNLCTEGDVCSQGVCSGAPINCDDDNVCTDDSCDPEIGCLYALNSAQCDDGNACTTDDICSEGACFGIPMDCDDGIECTVDTCVDGVCQHDDSACPPGPSCGDGNVDSAEECEVGYECYCPLGSTCNLQTCLCEEEPVGPYCAISGMKFNDENGNGVKDCCESGLEGWTIQLKQPLACTEGEEWADEVIEYNQGTRSDGSPIDLERTDPSNSLGSAQYNDTVNFVSLGFGGSLILKFDNFIINGDGNDLEVVETSYGSPSCSSYPEKVHVYASQTGEDGSWEDLGVSCLDGEFDLGELSWAQYLKLVDETDPEDFGGVADGFDIDGVRALNCLSGWEIIDTEITDENGNYCFESVEPGDYRLEEILKPGWINTTPLYQDLTVIEGEPIIVDFGNYQEEEPEPCCGDGNLDLGEGCDDGNNENGDGCSSECRTEGGPTPPVCGNGIVESGEGCDDGNTDDSDGCSSQCQLELVCNPEEELVVNGGFEAPIVISSENWDIFDSLGVSGWTIEWVAVESPYNGYDQPADAYLEFQRLIDWTPYEGDQYVELDADWDGSGGSLHGEPASAKIYQDIATIPGETYSVKFYFSPRPDTNEANNQLEFSWDGTAQPVISGAGGSSTNWSEYTYQFTAAGATTRLQFADLGTSDSLGTFLDDVSVRCQLPEPECEPGEERSCDTGYLGVCAEGNQICDEEGFWGECLADNEPVAEDCSNDLDDDCDGYIDGDDSDCGGTEPECTDYYKDADADGYGITEDTQCLTEPTGDYTATQGGDCDDTNPDVNPGATEICGDGIDNDCDGSDSACEVIYGGGGGGGGPIFLTIFNEKNGGVLSISVTVSWFTNLLATSRVIYDTVPQSALSAPPNYGYAYSTIEDPDKVTFHTVTITGLLPGTTYYWRAISHGSPETWGDELSFTTLSGEEGIEEETEEEEEEEIEETEILPEEGEETGGIVEAEEGVPGEEAEEAEEEVKEGEEEIIVEAEEAPVSDFTKFLAAIGGFFNLGNLCWLFFLAVVILAVLFLISQRRKEEQIKKRRWIFPLLLAVLIVLYCIFCCSSCWILILITAILIVLAFLLEKRKKKTGEGGQVNL